MHITNLANEFGLSRDTIKLWRVKGIEEEMTRKYRTGNGFAHRGNHSKYPSNDSGTFVVYHIPAHYYVGITDNIQRRCREHHSHGGFDLTDVHILSSHDNPYDALAEEAKYHRMGYAGCQYDRVSYKRQIYYGTSAY